MALGFWVGNLSTMYLQESVWPSGPETEKSLKKFSTKSLRGLFFRLSRLFRDFFWALGGSCTRGRGEMEPFVLLAFFPPFYSNLLPNLRPILVTRPMMVSLPFPLVLSAFQLASVVEPRIHHLSCSGPKMAFSDSQTLRLIGEIANFEAKNAIKLGKKAKRTNGSIFTHVR